MAIFYVLDSDGIVLETYVRLVKLASSHLRQVLSNTYVTSRLLKYGMLYP